MHLLEGALRRREVVALAAEPVQLGGQLVALAGELAHRGAQAGAVGGPGAELLREPLHLGQAVMAHNGTLDYFAESVFNYPTLGEAYKYAAYDALEKMRDRNVTPIHAKKA